MNTEEKLPAINKVPKAIKTIEEKLKAIKKITSQSNKTNGKFYWNPNYQHGTPINLFSVKDISLLTNMHQYIRTKHVAYAESAKELGLKEYPAFTWLDYTYEEWDFDIKMRIAIIKQHTTVAKLERGKAALEKFLTEEHQIESIVSSLGLDI